MRIVEIDSLPNGAHNNQSYPGFVPDGWAVIPDDVETKNFPFGVPAIDYDHGVPTVVHWIPGVMPDPDPTPAPEPETEPSVWDELDAAYKEGVDSV